MSIFQEFHENYNDKNSHYFDSLISNILDLQIQHKLDLSDEIDRRGKYDRN